MKWLLPSGTSSKFKPEENIWKETEKVDLTWSMLSTSENIFSLRYFFATTSMQLLQKHSEGSKMAHFRVFRGTEVFLQNSGLFFQYLLHFLFNNVCFRFNMCTSKYDSKMSFLFDVCSNLFFFRRKCKEKQMWWIIDKFWQMRIWKRTTMLYVVLFQFAFWFVKLPFTLVLIDWIFSMNRQLFM